MQFGRRRRSDGIVESATLADPFLSPNRRCRHLKRLPMLRLRRRNLHLHPNLRLPLNPRRSLPRRPRPQPLRPPPTGRRSSLRTELAELGEELQPVAQ